MPDSRLAMRRFRIAVGAALWGVAATACARDPGQAAAAGSQAAAVNPIAPPGAPANLFPAPSRPVADIVSARWSDEHSRDVAGEANRVMELLGVRPGMTVADIGAGSGYYTVRLARRLGPSGRVIAQDIVPRYLRELRERVTRERLDNVTLARGEPHDPRLPPASVDLALLVHMYHEIEQPYALLYNLLPALRPGARVAVLDLDRSTRAHGTPPALLRCEFSAVGYTQVAFHKLPHGSGYLAVFQPPPSREHLVAPRDIRACAA